MSDTEPAADSPLLVPIALVGTLAVVLGVYSLWAWADAESDFAPYWDHGVVCTGRVVGKSEQTSRTRTGSSSTYRLYVAFDIAPEGGTGRRVHTSVTEHVYYPSYQHLDEGDAVELLVLPESPEAGVRLREVVMSNTYRPITLVWWTPLVAGLLALGCFLLYRRL